MTAPPPPAPPLRYRPIEPTDLARVKLLNSILFPIKYADEVYQHALACGDVTQLAFCGNDLVGALVARLEKQPESTARLYIVSLGVLAPHRRSGIGSELLRRSLEACEEDEAITHACLHVHSPNAEAIAFYQGRGFRVTARVEGYYKRLDPQDAVVLTKRLHGPSST